MWLFPTPGGAWTRNTRGAVGSSRASAIVSATATSRRACSGRGVAPPGKCARRSSASVLLRIGSRVASYHGRMAESRTQPVLQFSAGGLVVDERGRVLLIRARDLRNQPVWTLPKGTLDPGESSGRGAARGARGDRLSVRGRARAGRGDVLVPARRAADQEDGPLVPHAADREGRRPRPGGGRGRVARTRRGAPPPPLRLGPPPRRGPAALGHREEPRAVLPGDLLGHLHRELGEPLLDVAHGGPDDLPARRHRSEERRVGKE